MKRQQKVHQVVPSTKRHEARDLESFLDRMHLGDTVARCAYEVFQSHGSAPNAEVEEDWTKAESERLDRLSRQAGGVNRIFNKTTQDN